MPDATATNGVLLGHGETNLERQKHEPEFVLTRRHVIVLSTLLVACGVQTSSYTLLVSFYPTEASKKQNTGTQFGFVLGVYPFVGFITSPLWGKLIANKVRAKTMLVTGIMIDGIFGTAMGFAKWINSELPFFAYGFSMRFLEATGFAIALTCYYAIIAEEFKERVERYLPLIETVFGLGLMSGPAIGAICYDFGGFTAPFFILGALISIQGVIIGCFLPNTEQEFVVVDANPKSKKNMREMLDFHTCVNIVCVSLSCFITGFNDATLTVYLIQFNLSTSVKGFCFLICGGVYAISSLAFGRFCKSVNDCRYFVIFGSACNIVAFTFMGPLPIFDYEQSLTIVLLMQVLLGLGAGAIYVCTYMDTLDYITTKKKFPKTLATNALLSGIMSSAFMFGAFAGPIIGGALLDNVGYCKATAYVIVLIIFVFLVLVVAVIRDQIKSSRYNGNNDEFISLRSKL